MEPPDAPGRLAGAMAATVALSLRAPWLVLVLTFASVGAAAYYAATRLEYRTQRNDLIAKDKDCQIRWQRYLDAFGDDDDLVVVIRGNDRIRMAAAADTVAARLRQHPKLFDRVFHEVDLRNLYAKSLFFLSVDELQSLAHRLDGMEPLLGPLGPLTWRTLSLHALVVQGTVARQSPTPNPANRDLMALLPGLFDSATRALANPNDYRNPWQLAGDDARSVMLREPQKFFTPDGRLALVLARPVKDAQSFTPVRAACATARAILQEARAANPDLEFGLTGLPVLETDEMAASEEDSTFASWLALAGVAVLYFVVYRGARYPLLTVGTLLVGCAWALGWAALTVGHLNILSATFAVMIIGMGDYGVLWVARYDEERRYGRDVAEALMETARHAGPGIATAAVTTSLAFFATMLADFQAVAELGWIAGCGVLFCAVACSTVLPALLVLLESGRDAAAPRTIPIASARPFLPFVSAKPRLVLLLGLVLLAGAALGGGRVRYDSNLLNMQAKGLDSVAWEHELIRHAAGATWDAMSLVRTRGEALELKARYEALPGVGRVVEAASLLPEDGEAKRSLVAAIHAKLANLPESVADPVAADPAAVAELLRDWPGTAAIVAELGRSGASDRLREFDRKLRRDLFAALRELRAVSRPEPITTYDLPRSFRERYIGRHGEFLVRAFASDSLWEFDRLETFTQAATTVDRDATGKSFRTLEGLRQMKAGFELAGLLALGVIVVVLWLDFRDIRRVLLGLLPLVVGIVFTLGILGIAGIPLNPANLIALPLIVGVGVDNGVHVLHDYSERLPGKLYRLGAATGRGISVAALTTILGFGTLALARHRGMAGMGLTLAIGVAACMLAAIVVLPAVLRLADARALRRAEHAERATPVADRLAA
ncbi:MAG: MMPL family transporter [Planctomycetia bacterium]|nr:MMPL family transporter [Planctomycetia bacterium]